MRQLVVALCILLLMLSIVSCTNTPNPPETKYRIFAIGMTWYTDNYSIVDGRLVMHDYYSFYGCGYKHYNQDRYFSKDIGFTIDTLE